jgi:hypothetical protein
LKKLISICLLNVRMMKEGLTSDSEEEDEKDVDVVGV